MPEHPSEKDRTPSVACQTHEPLLVRDAMSEQLKRRFLHAKDVSEVTTFCPFLKALRASVMLTPEAEGPVLFYKRCLRACASLYSPINGQNLPHRTPKTCGFQNLYCTDPNKT